MQACIPLRTSTCGCTVKWFSSSCNSRKFFLSLVLWNQRQDTSPSRPGFAQQRSFGLHEWMVRYCQLAGLLCKGRRVARKSWLPAVLVFGWKLLPCHLIVISLMHIHCQCMGALLIQKVIRSGAPHAMGFCGSNKSGGGQRRWANILTWTLFSLSFLRYYIIHV